MGGEFKRRGFKATSPDGRPRTVETKRLGGCRQKRDAQRLGVSAEGSVRITNVSAPFDDGHALGRNGRQGSNEFPDGAIDEGAWADRPVEGTAGEPSTGTCDPRQVGGASGRLID